MTAAEKIAFTLLGMVLTASIFAVPVLLSFCAKGAL